MLKNDEQLNISNEQIRKFEEAVEKLEKNKGKMGQKMYEMQLNAMKGELFALKKEVNEYLTMKHGNFSIENNLKLESVYQILIKARKARGLSQKQLADKLGLTQQQIQRYESTNYETASLSRIVEVMEGLGIEIRLEKISLFDIAFNFPPNMTKEEIKQRHKKLVEKGTFISLN